MTTRPEHACRPHAEARRCPYGASKEEEPRPGCPDGLLPSTKKVWRNFWKSDVAKAADVEVDMSRIVRWINAVDEYDRVSPIVKQTRLVKGSTGQPVLNPLVAYLNMLALEIRAAEDDLGLSPLARLRLGVFYGQVRLTAQELNDRLRQKQAAKEPPSGDSWEDEWEV